MTPVEWPLRLMPRRKPAPLSALAVMVLCVASAIGLRVAIIGADKGLGLSVSYFPALLLVTLYGGAGWGAATLMTAVGLQWLAPSTLTGGATSALTLLFVASGAVVILFADLFRSTVVRLDESRAAQRETQRVLEEAETRLRLAQDAGGVGIWSHDAASGVSYLSPTMYRNAGLPPTSGAGLDELGSTTHPDDYAMHVHVQKAARTGVLQPYEYRVVHPDGSIRWLLTRGEVIRGPDGRITGAHGVNIDVTERRLAEELVRESEARFRALADSAPAPMWVARADGGREFVNRAYCEYVGLSYTEALEVDWRERLHPDDLERVLNEHSASRKSSKPFTLDARYLRADGEYRWLRSVSQRRIGPDGSFVGFVGVAVDATEAKRAEADLVRINDILAERVEAALAERDEAEAALRRAQKLEAVGQLTGGVAHDFNNLLTVITGALDLVRRHPEDVARRERMIEAALSAAKRGERLTQQLLAFSRRQALKPQLVDVDSLLRDAEPLLRRAVGEAVSATFRAGASGAVAEIDPAQFDAAIMNLVVNARDAVASGGAICIETSMLTLGRGEVPGVEPGCYVCVSVHDTGVGMDAETIARAFEPFFTTKDPGKGTGLGLSQVYGFAHQSGGGVAVSSAPGQGCTIRMFLPLSSQPAANAPSEGPQAAGLRGRRLKVMLAEDDAEVGGMVSAMLEDLGHEVVRAETADEALTLLRGAPDVDLLLTDLVMPGGKNGVELALEAVALYPRLPVILSSGYAGDTLQAAESAPWPILRKPYSARALADAIEAAELVPLTA